MKKVPKINIDKEKTLKKQLHFETLITELSSRFINLPIKEIDKEIIFWMEKISKFLMIDRVTLLIFSDDKTNSYIKHKWSASGISPLPALDTSKQFPWAIKQLMKGRIFRFNDINDLPEEAGIDKESFRLLGTKGHISIPLSVAGEVIGALSFGAFKQKPAWPDNIVKRLFLLGEIFVNVLMRQKKANELNNAFEEIKNLKMQLEKENINLKETIKCQHDFKEIIGDSESLKYSLYQLEQVAPTHTSVLIQGETGVGKELFANAIQKNSKRAHKPFIKLNCATLPHTLIESELFGHEKGAFTGAEKRKPGRFEIADGGTIFLDEISELPLELQTKLLRVLQDGEFERLGNPKTIKVDVRVITATNRQLLEEVKKGRFREDLFYRLNVFPITVPPLSVRKEDIPLLVNHFVKKHSKNIGKEIKTISQKTMTSLQDYSWPGNIRELENVIERSIITAKSSSLNIETFLHNELEPESRKTLSEIERDYILRILELKKWRISGQRGAALVLGIHPETLRSRMRKLGIDPSKRSNYHDM